MFIPQPFLARIAILRGQFLIDLQSQYRALKTRFSVALIRCRRIPVCILEQPEVDALSTRWQNHGFAFLSLVSN